MRCYQMYLALVLGLKEFISIKSSFIFIALGILSFLRVHFFLSVQDIYPYSCNLI